MRRILVSPPSRELGSWVPNEGLLQPPLESETMEGGQFQTWRWPGQGDLLTCSEELKWLTAAGCALRHRWKKASPASYRESG